MSVEALGSVGGNAGPAASVVVYPPLGMSQVLANDTLLPSFRLFCASQGVAEYLDFILRVREVQQVLEALAEGGQSVVEEEDKRVKSLYNRHLAPGAPEEVLLDPAIERELDDLFRRPGSPALVSSLEKAVSFAVDLVELKGLKPFLQSAAYRLFLKREKSLWIPSDASVPFDVREIEVQYRRVREGETHLTEFVFDVRAKVDAMRRSAQALRSLSDKFASFLFALESAPSSSSSQADPEVLSVLAKSLRKMAVAVRGLETLDQEMGDALESLLVEPLDSFLTDKMPRAHFHKKKYDKALEDRSLTASSTLPQETLVVLRRCNNAVDHLVFKGVVEMMKQYLYLCDKGHGYVQRALSSISSYREQLRASSSV